MGNGVNIGDRQSTVSAWIRVSGVECVTGEGFPDFLYGIDRSEPCRPPERSFRAIPPGARYPADTANSSWTSVTPGADHAAPSAARRSAIDDTVPVSVTIVPLV